MIGRAAGLLSPMYRVVCNVMHKVVYKVKAFVFKFTKLTKLYHPGKVALTIVSDVSYVKRGQDGRHS